MSGSGGETSRIHGTSRAKFARAVIVTVVAGATIPVSIAFSTAARADESVTVQPIVTSLPDGGTQSTYDMPDGTVMTTNTPPAGFDPLTASAEQLSEYNFPAEPSDPAAAAAWTAAMSAYVSDPAPGPLTVDTTDSNGGPIYGNWAGYVAGDRTAVDHHYVAIKDSFTVPNISNCNTDDSLKELALWVGLGGADSGNGNDLLQQGLECGEGEVGPGSGWRPFGEFADLPVFALCGRDQWVLNPGDSVYQNMSYESSPNEAFFYLEDTTTGKVASCSKSKPNNWSFNGATAEWVAEAPLSVSPTFNTIGFFGTQAELNSDSSWVKLGTQSPVREREGTTEATDCMGPGAIQSDNESFYVIFNRPTCG